MKREKLISWTFWPEFAVFTTCHKATAEIRITTQKIIVLTVEFTKAPKRGTYFPNENPISAEYHYQLDAAEEI